VDSGLAITITPILKNGEEEPVAYSVKVGCQAFFFNTREALLHELDHYFCNIGRCIEAHYVHLKIWNGMNKEGVPVPSEGVPVPQSNQSPIVTSRPVPIR